MFLDDIQSVSLGIKQETEEEITPRTRKLRSSGRKRVRETEERDDQQEEEEQIKPKKMKKGKDKSSKQHELVEEEREDLNTISDKLNDTEGIISHMQTVVTTKFVAHN